MSAKRTSTQVSTKNISKVYPGYSQLVAVLRCRRMTGDQERGVTAQTILTIRSLRKSMFPSEIFDEFAWNMLLVLFVGLAGNEVVSEAALIARADVSVSAGRRWITHLIEDGQIADRHDDDDVILTPRAVSQLREFLDQARVVGEESLLPTA